MKPTASNVNDLPIDPFTADDAPTVAAPAATAAAVPSRWVDYYELTKPRMNFLVVLTTMVGFYMASRGPLNWMSSPSRYHRPAMSRNALPSTASANE